MGVSVGEGEAELVPSMMELRSLSSKCQIGESVIGQRSVSVLQISCRCSSGERSKMDLSMRSVMTCEGRGSPSAVMVCNTSGARFRSRNTCETLAREMPCLE
jgi:hypothetical protein